MVGKNHLHPFYSHFRSISSKIMRFSNRVILGSANLHGSVSASKWSIFSTLSCKCSPFPWRVFNFEILALESGISASPNFRFFSIFSQYWSSRSNLSCLNDRLYHSLHILLTRHADFLIWLPSICEKSVILEILWVFIFKLGISVFLSFCLFPSPLSLSLFLSFFLSFFLSSFAGPV